MFKHEKEQKKKIYFILSYSGTILSHIIRFKTKAKYCHVSIALDENLNKMYSFGRLNPYNPFIGGFVHEGIDHGFFKRFNKTEIVVYSLELTEKQYRQIEKRIVKMEKEKEIYTFNVVGLFGAGFNIKYRKKNSFYCAEFVKYLLDEANVKLGLPELIKPEDFQRIGNLELVYKGIFSKYKKNKNKRDK